MEIDTPYIFKLVCLFRSQFCNTLKHFNANLDLLFSFPGFYPTKVPDEYKKTAVDMSL